MSGVRVAPGEAANFLSALFAGKPDELYVLLWTLPEKRSRWFLKVEPAIKFAESMGERDLYVGVGFSKKDYGPSFRCRSEEIGGLVGMSADLDIKSEAHPKNLPSTIPEALTVLPEQLPATLLIGTGNGAQGW